MCPTLKQITHCTKDDGQRTLVIAKGKPKFHVESLEK